MYLTKTDLSSGIYPEVANLIARYTDSIIEMHFATAQGEIESYLSGRYAIHDELAKTGNDRQTLLVSIARDLAIYHLYGSQESIPAHRVKRYEQAITMLTLMQQGKASVPGVALAPSPPTSSTGSISGGTRQQRPQVF